MVRLAPSRLKSALERANERFDSNEIGSTNRIQASDNIWNHSGMRADGMRLRATTPAEYSGTKTAITKWDWQQTLDASRKLYSRVGEVAGAFRQKADYAIGDSWQPQFQGKNQGWGRIAEAAIENWFLRADIRGEPFDFITSLKVDSVHLDRDGDHAMHCCYKNGEPRVKFYQAGAIGFRQGVGQDINGYGKVPAGMRFAGLDTYNGAVYDADGTVVGYGILGRTAAQDTVLGVEQCQVLFDPDWSDQGRGIPAVARASMLSAMDYEDIAHFIKRQVKQDSAMGILHYNEDGSAPNPTGADFMQNKASGSTNMDVIIEQMEGNEINYFKAQGGGKIEPYNSSRPHPNIDAHNMRLLRGVLLASGWFYELYDPREVKGAGTRLIQDQARASINCRQSITHKRWIRAIAHFLAWAMEKGVVPVNNDNDWLDFFPTLPAKVTVDARYDDKTKLERIRSGGGTYAAMFGDEGKNWQKEIRQRITEQKFIQDECKAQGVDIEKVQILTPNGNPQQAEAEEKEEKEGDE